MSRRRATGAVMSRARWVAAVALLGPTGLAGQADDGAPLALGPFEVRAGFQDGAFAVEVDADSTLALWTSTGARLLAYTGVRADGLWTRDVDQSPSFAISLRPGLAVQSISESAEGAPRTTGGWLHGYADLRYRALPAREEDATGDDAPAFLSQLLGGGGVELRAAPVPLWLAGRWRLASIPEVPRLSLTYYRVLESSLPDSMLPRDLAADAWQLRAGLELPLPVLCTEIEPGGPVDDDDPFGDGGPPPRRCGLRLSGEAVSTFNTGRAPEWLGEVVLAWFIGDRWAPVLRYRSGDEHGLHYDAQLLLGLLLRF